MAGIAKGMNIEQEASLGQANSNLDFKDVIVGTDELKKALSISDKLWEYITPDNDPNSSKIFNRDKVVVPVYMAKGLEFDNVIIYTDKFNKYTDEEKYLYYVAITRAQHRLIVYNQEK